MKKKKSLDLNDNTTVVSDLKNQPIDQIKRVTQEKKIKQEIQNEIESKGKISINSFEQLIKTCTQNKEMKLKYELEKNVNLVNFERNRVEISFNDNLDKNFVKDISLKLFEWTGNRWIISLSKIKGEISVKQKEENKKNQLIEESKETELYKNILKKFPDAKLVRVKPKEE